MGRRGRRRTNFTLVFFCLGAFFTGGLRAQAPPPASEHPCLALVGDSIPYGSVVYIIPGHGFAILRLPPLSLALQAALDERGHAWQVRDFSAEAAFLSEAGRKPYVDFPVYQELLAADCPLTLIMPWVNDMSIERPNPVRAHINDLAAFIETLQRANPAGRIVLLGFYDGQPSDFAKQHAAGFTTENVILYNRALEAACEPNGVLGRAGFLCMPTAPLFEDLENAHVALGASREDVLNFIYEPIPPDVLPLFEVYWRDNPQGLVYGDGVHLNAFGKALLSEAVVVFLRQNQLLDESPAP